MIDRLDIMDPKDVCSDMLTMMFLIPLFCILYSMISIWIYDHHEDRDKYNRYYREYEEPHKN